MELNHFFHEMYTVKNFLYHGSSVQGIDILKPLSKLHNADKKVIYLTGNLPYALVYIWDSIKTGTNQKWVTCGLENGVVYYEEQFPNQLKEFYEGVEGYIYVVPKSNVIQGVEKREQMYFSTNSLSVTKTIYVPDVYQALCKCQQEGTFRLLKFTDATPEKQQQLIDMISDCIKQSGGLNANNEDSHFFQRYFKEAWKKAKSENNSEPFGIVQEYRKQDPRFVQFHNSLLNGAEMNAQQLYELAMKHIYGDGVPEDNDRAFVLLTKAHHMGHIEATYNLGICYHYGFGTNVDLKKAYILYLRSAEAGYGKGMELIGRFYNQGIYVEENRAKAKYWLYKVIQTEEPDVVVEAEKELAESV